MDVNNVELYINITVLEDKCKSDEIKSIIVYSLD